MLHHGKHPEGAVCHLNRIHCSTCSQDIVQQAYEPICTWKLFGTLDKNTV